MHDDEKVVFYVLQNFKRQRIKEKKAKRTKSVDDLYNNNINMHID